MSEKKVNKIFYLVLILIPVLFFVLLELSLRALDYGYDTEVFTEVKPGWLEVNPKLARKYFHNVKNLPSTNKDVFRKIKPQNGYRVFVLGGSSGAGYPYIPLGAFTRYLRTRLELAYPNRTIEVVNMSLTAINSYALRDMIDAVLEQKPDVILIYAGHNEYYGALGVGSMENLGTSPALVNLVLKLENLKTFQLVRNIIKGAVKAIAGKDKRKSGTLMARMAEKKKIPFDSELYKKGVEQFNENMEAVFERAKRANVPVVISTLACNLLDQKPFISEAAENFPSADEQFEKARIIFEKGNVKRALPLFVEAKDLDMLRFRAPSEINKSIKTLAKKYNAPLADAFTALMRASEKGIVGNDLMTDHLHPDLRGYQIIGKTFYATMATHHLLPKDKPAVSYGFQDKLTREKFAFTELDSVVAKYKIKLLKNDWPFTEPQNKLPESKLIVPKNYVDSLAREFVLGKIDWIAAHEKLAEYYWKRKDYVRYSKAMKTVISQFPIVPRFYETAATKLLAVKRFDEAYEILLKQFKTIPDAFCTKWLGILNLRKGKNNAAIFYLKKSLEYDNGDAQVYYNMAGAYVSKKKYAEALSLVNKALRINPKYERAKNLKLQLESVLRGAAKTKRKKDAE